MAGRLDHLDDEELLARAARDGDAFGIFYRRHERTVALYCRRRSAGAESTADAVAETFAIALRTASRFRPGGPPPIAWLLGIARNVLREAHRKGRVQDATRRRLGMQPLTYGDQTLERIDALLDAEAEARHWGALLAALPEDQRAAVWSRVIDEEDYDEIAERLATTEAAVRQRVSRGLRALRRAHEETS